MDSLSRGSSNPEGPSTRIVSVSVPKIHTLNGFCLETLLFGYLDP